MEQLVERIKVAGKLSLHTLESILVIILIIIMISSLFGLVFGSFVLGHWIFLNIYNLILCYGFGELIANGLSVIALIIYIISLVMLITFFVNFINAEQKK